MPRTRKTTSKMGRLAEALSYGGVIPPMDVIYQSDVCERLIKTYKLDCTVEVLGDALISAGAAYMQAGPIGYTPLRDGPELPELFNAVAKTSDELIGYLAAASGTDLAGFLFHAESQGIRPGKTRGMNGAWYPTRDDRDLKLHIWKLLGALARAARENLSEATAARKPKKRGRPNHPSIEIFVSLLAQFWSKIKGRPFTVDYSKGSGGKNAVRFIIDALKQLDSVPDTAIITAARKVRKQLTDK